MAIQNLASQDMSVYMRDAPEDGDKAEHIFKTFFVDGVNFVDDMGNRLPKKNIDEQIRNPARVQGFLRRYGAPGMRLIKSQEKPIHTNKPLFCSPPPMLYAAILALQMAKSAWNSHAAIKKRTKFVPESDWEKLENATLVWAFTDNNGDLLCNVFLPQDAWEAVAYPWAVEYVENPKNVVKLG